MAGHGPAWPGMVRHGQAWPRMAGLAWHGRASPAWPGWPGVAGLAGHGEAGPQIQKSGSLTQERTSEGAESTE